MSSDTAVTVTPMRAYKIDIATPPPMQRFDIEAGHDFASEDIEKTEPITLLSVVCRHPKVRWFAYFCGIDSPELNRQMTWYQVIAFLWVWTMRVNFSFSVVEAIIDCTGKEFTRSMPILKVFDVFFAIKMWSLIPILYDICWRKRPTFRFPRIDNYFAAVKRPIVEGYSLLTLLTIFSIIFAYLVMYYSKAPNGWLAGTTYYSAVAAEAFIFFTMSYELMYIESVLDRELIAPAEKGLLTTAKYKALRAFLDDKMATTILAFSCFTIILTLSCVNLVGVIYYFKLKPMPMFQRILNVYLFEGKDILYLFLIVWKISSINEKSKNLTLRIADNKPTEDNTYIYMQQNSKPIVYKIFGLVSLYQTELIVSCIGYIVSFAISLAKGLENSK